MNAVIYARFSSHNQQEQSIEGQIRYCTEYAKKNDMTIINSYIDRAISGTSDNRPEFLQMIKDSNNHQFNVVLVWKLDRFARNRYDSAIYKNALKKNNVKVVSVTEYLGEGSESVLLEAMLEAMAETYSRQLSENVRRGMRESALKCQVVGGSVPLGFDTVDKKYVINKKEAEIVRFIFGEYVSGTSKKEIVNKLNAKGWRTKNGSTFVFNSLNKILSNRKYIGEYKYEDIVIEHGIPAIIDDRTFNLAQKQLSKNKQNRGTKSAKHEYLLATKIFCGCCGGSMIGETATGKGGGKFGYYVCRNRKKHINDCKKRREKQKELETFIVERTLYMYKNKDFVNEVAQKVVDLYNKECGNNHLKTLELNKKDLEKKLEELSDGLLKTTNARVLKKFNEQINNLDNQLAELEIEIAREKAIANATMRCSDVIDFISDIMDGDINDKQFQKKIIDTFINAIYVFDDKFIVYYNGSNTSDKVTFDDLIHDLENKGVEGSTFNTLTPPNKYWMNTYFFSGGFAVRCVL